MSKSGQDLEVDLSALRVVATIDLPSLAYTYGELNNVVAGTADYDSASFASPGQEGWVDQVCQPWTELRNTLQNILGNTANVLLDTGAVLNHVVDTYAATDSTAGQLLRDAWSAGPPTLDPAEVAPPYRQPTIVLSNLT